MALINHYIMKTTNWTLAGKFLCKLAKSAVIKELIVQLIKVFNYHATSLSSKFDFDFLLSSSIVFISATREGLISHSSM